MEDFEQTETPEGGADNKRKFMWIGIILAVVLAVAIPTIVTLRAKDAEPQVTLVSLDAKLDEIHTNLGHDIDDAKANVAWVKENVANLASEVDGTAEDLNAITTKVNKLDSIITKIDTLNDTVTGLDSDLGAMNTTLTNIQTTLGELRGDVDSLLVALNVTGGD